MLTEIIKKYRDKSRYDLSCSETMIYAANEAYNLNLDKKTLKALAPFSGGMFKEDTCGALTGSLAVLGILFTNEVAHKSDHLKELVQEFHNKFEEKLKSRNCAELKPMYRSETKGCNDIIYTSGEILDKIVTRELSKKY
ncbi:C-GCAxxG-C-C family (seleno)protein [Haloimpatiens sp. FM7330]|uniref:C-GCAxxG-C-C family (seleno)protein n=1 Tax=Haloimpatiens sp. FM7330 TaxID=3298610 RepID=UPI0036427127